jgi:hypothetical protein
MSMPKTAPYQEGRFDYNECFFGPGGFLSADANEEKHMMSLYLQVLAEEMAKRRVVFGGSEPLRWLEPGIGDGSSTAKFIAAMAPAHAAGFIVYGSDYQPESVERARINIPRLCPSNTRIGELTVKDAFSGKPLSAEECDFAMLSHFIYHLKNQLDGGHLSPKDIDRSLVRLIDGIMSSLREDGLVFSFHEGAASDMFGKLGVEYGSAMNDAPDRIRKAAADVGVRVISMPLESNLYFPDLPNEALQRLKLLERWADCVEGTPEASWLKKFLFALHNTRHDDAGDGILKEGGVRDIDRLPSARGNRSRMGDAIDRLVDLFKRDELGPHIIIRSEMQAILKNRRHAEAVSGAFAEVEKRLPEIRQATRAAMLAAKQVQAGQTQ